MDKTKPFGLIITKRSQSYKPSTSAVFGADSDDEPTVSKKKMPKIPQAKPKKPAPKDLCEDPSIYEYDSIYDDMKAQEVAKAAPKEANKPSRYIESLLKAADKRKKDQERRVEKKVQNEREQEGDKFKDKEAFVTTAYKKKMLEMEAEEERERRENMLNEMMDVTKQKDLSGFYRHFLKQSIGEEKVPVFGERYSVKQEVLDESEGGGEIAGEPIVVKKEKHSDEEEAGTKDAIPNENIDRGRDPSSNVKDVRRNVSDAKGKESRRDVGNKHSMREKASLIDENIDQDSDIDSSSNDEGPNEEDVQRKVPSAKEKVSKTDVGNSHVMKEKASLVDKNIDRDSDIASSSNGEGPSGTETQMDVSKEGPLKKKIPKRGVGNKQPTKEKGVIVDDIDRDSELSSSEDENTKNEKQVMVSDSSKDVGKKSSGKSGELDFPRKRKRSENSGKLHRNIRKRTEDDDSPSGEESPSEDDDDDNAGSAKENGDDKENHRTLPDKKQKDAQSKMPKRDIYAKRTVGDVFADAQARYFQRMATQSN